MTEIVKRSKRSFTSYMKRIRKQADEMEDRINKELEEKFTAEDNRFQAALHELKVALSLRSEENEKLKKAVQNGRAELLVKQSHKLVEHKARSRNHKCFDVDDLEKYGTNFSKMFELTTEKELAPEWFDINEPENLRVIKTNFGQVYLTFTRNIK